MEKVGRHPVFWCHCCKLSPHEWHGVLCTQKALSCWLLRCLPACHASALGQCVMLQGHGAMPHTCALCRRLAPTRPFRLLFCPHLQAYGAMLDKWALYRRQFRSVWDAVSEALEGKEVRLG